MAKNKKRRIIVVAALCCAMLLLFFPIVYSPPAETAYLSSEPWAKEVKFVGWDYVRYNYYLYRNIMLGYPWVVRMAYTIVFFCCVATFLLFIAMAWDVYRRRKLDRKNERLRKRYYDKIMELARMDHSLSIPEIKSAIEYKKTGLVFRGISVVGLYVDRYPIRKWRHGGGTCKFAPNRSVDRFAIFY